MRWAIHVAHMGEMRNAYKILVRKPKGKRTHRRSSHRWNNNIRMNLREIGQEDLDWTPWLRTGTSGNSCEHGNEPSGSIKGRIFLD
jgi:hypothetical protein